VVFGYHTNMQKTKGFMVSQQALVVVAVVMVQRILEMIQIKIILVLNRQINAKIRIILIRNRKRKRKIRRILAK
jgi:hypothetical protein